ncbi:GAF domain-containing sensor histidine kinase [Salinimicrobium oceani]|uniref:histidine kinase n=1 Tax=Salinimicrobium oceani TaxID=2722702 RepID=A0ABX1CTY1_9FLAO|nr:GAF domain-containing sensor histidine kinase [Salinimicrobium oceani]NJW51375.1 GAF domain-containing sensor histidine kinase [Salinimicrobium oceani]
MLQIVCSTTNLRFAAIARVTNERWVACATMDNVPLGLNPSDELNIDDTFCQQVHREGEIVIFDDVDKSERYCDHHVPKLYGIKSYISVPIYKRNGEFFGTLCALDSVPGNIDTDEVKGMFRLFTDLISFHLNAQDEVKAAEAELQEERKVAELRDQFIAILGHDLKNPIATMRMSADILLKMSKEELTQRHAAMIKSTSYRMQGLIENILDFARGQMGEGLVLEKKAHNGSLQEMMEQVIKEIKITTPNREIIFTCELQDEVWCDKNRIGQLLSNLLANADQHGHADAPIFVKAITTGTNFELSVTNKGKKIPTESLEHLFQPFYREDDDTKKGLGLGLFIASEIAKAHEGQLLVTSTEEETSFTLQIPASA